MALWTENQRGLGKEWLKQEKEAKEEAEGEVTTVEEGGKVKAIRWMVIEEKVKEQTENQSSSEGGKDMEDVGVT